MSIKTISRVKMDCNWMVVEAAKMREQVKAIKLAGVESLEARLLVKIEVRGMDYNELNKFLKAAK